MDGAAEVPRQDGRAAGRRQTLAVGAIFRNEGPYILEWLAWHRALGVDRFFLADNASDDGSGALLAALAGARLVEHLPFPGRPGEAPQLPAYDEILRRHGRDADWIAFIDADEFLAPAAPLRALRPLLAGLAGRGDVGAVAVNWAVYGSAGEAEARPGLVVERFPCRAPQQAEVNRHYKTILAPRAFAGLEATPHLFRLRPGFSAVHADGRPLAGLAGLRQGLSETVVWAPLRLNHYVVKSREECFGRKLVRGRATQDRPREPGFFAAHDRNDEREAPPRWLVAATRREMSRLRLRLRAAGWRGAEPPLRAPAPAPDAPAPAPAAALAGS
jgi:hypothetical protein